LVGPSLHADVKWGYNEQIRERSGACREESLIIILFMTLHHPKEEEKENFE
jgi:hypothetical protein